MRLARTLLLAILALASCVATAEQPRRLGHYVHQRWLGNSEVPVPVLAMAQGHDGFIWLATGDGLFRFDGTRFEQIDVRPRRLAHDPPSTLLVTRNGDVWTNFETTRRFAVYRQGMLRLIDTPPAPSRIADMVEGNDGAIWALTSSYNAEVMRFHEGKWRRFGSADGLPQTNVSNMLMGHDGTLWIASLASVLRLRPGTEVFEVFRHASNARVAQDMAGRIWLSDEKGTYAITGPDGRGAPEAAQLRYQTGGMDIRGSPVFDSEGNLWVATRYNGVQWFGADGARLPDGKVAAETFTSRDGLPSDVTNNILEDREGNIWVGTEGGLDRFRASTLVSEPMLSTPATFGDKLLEGADGTVYIGQAKTLYRVRPHGSPEPLIRDIQDPQALCEAPDGALWIALATHILVWSERHAARTMERPDKGANHNIVYDCAFDSRGDYWISAAGGGVHRYRNQRWEKVFDAGGHADFYPTSMVASPRGGVVFQAGDRLVWATEAGQATTNLDFGKSSLNVLTLHRAGDRVFAAGAFGLSRYREDAVDTAWIPEISYGSRINGIVETPEGDLWLAYPKSLARLSPKEVEHAFATKILAQPGFSLGPGDGLSSRPHSHSQRAMVRGGDGRLWIATETGTVWMDPARIVRNLVPPGVAITSIRDDARAYHDPTRVRLPAATSKIEIDYAVLSYADQARAQVRYKLEGFDEGWVNPGQRRQAFYTNLAPGKYRFRVIAANDDGVWNVEGAALHFEIPRTFFQSFWFLLLCVVLALMTLFALHRLRVAQAAHRVRVRLEERHAERERIARELHDTLLQGVMGLILRFQAVANRIPPQEASSGQLESVLAAADDIVVDARQRVQDLRGTNDSGDISAIIERVVAGIPFDPPLPIRIVIEGRPRALYPLVSAEVGKIVREGLLNVVHHARATSADIAIGFESRHFAVRIHDNGVGFPETVLRKGHKEGHFGLVGMRERAERIGGTLTIDSDLGQGSEVTLILPAKLAYARRRPHRRTWWSRLTGRPADD